VAALVCSPARPVLTSQVTIYGWSTSQSSESTKAQEGIQLSRRQLREAIEDYPYAMRERVLDYALRVEESAQAIFSDVGHENPTQGEIDQLVFVAGLRKLWSMVEFQFRTLQSVVTADQYGVAGLRAGGVVYRRDSSDYLAVRDLRDDLWSILRQGGMLELVRTRRLSDVAAGLI
jgi:hypothetical protein